MLAFGEHRSTLVISYNYLISMHWAHYSRVEGAGGQQPAQGPPDDHLVP